MSAATDDGFLARWSRRKVEAGRGSAVPAEPLPPAPADDRAAAPAERAMPGAPADTVRADAVPGAEAASQPAPPTLDDVAALTPASDFARFVGRDVDADVKNAALKKLFADPHFNVMDGLDTYIDDYNRIEPMPRSLLRQTMQARVLGLLDDELEEQPAGALPEAAAALSTGPQPQLTPSPQPQSPQPEPSAPPQPSQAPAVADALPAPAAPVPPPGAS